MNKYFLALSLNTFSLYTMHTEWLTYINYKSPEGKTALHNLITEVKAYDDFCVILETLLQEGCAINTQDKEGITPLHQAVLESKNHQNSVEFIQKLLKEGANPNIQDERGQTSLHKAILEGNDNKKSIELIQKLLEYNAQPNIPDNKGNIPAHYACEKGHQNTILILKLNGADLHHQNKEHKSSFDLLSRKKNEKLFDPHNNNTCVKGSFPQS